MNNKKLNYKCKVCGHVTRSDAGIYGHLRAKHNMTGVSNYERTEEKPTPTRGKHAKTPRKYTRHVPTHQPAGFPLVVEKDTQFIEIPIVLRIPISIGDVIMANQKGHKDE